MFPLEIYLKIISYINDIGEICKFSSICETYFWYFISEYPKIIEQIKRHKKVGLLEYTAIKIFGRYVRHGTYTKYYSMGGIKEKTKYVFGLKHGSSIEYYPSQIVKLEINYSYGIFHGKYVTRFPGGGVCRQFNIKNGLIHGKNEQFYPNGNLCEVSWFINGKHNGYYFKYDRQMRLEITGNYRNGNRHGLFRHFIDEDIIFDEIYSYGKLVSTRFQV